MAQKAPILMYNEAQGTLINTVNYFMNQGVPAYQIKQIFDLINIDLIRLVEEETKRAEEEYNQALAKEQETTEEVTTEAE